ncbi:alpha-glucosidase [Frondihabitans sp. PhB188]|uniref:glycoside hydrolase family 13 protein n=1 Tax=Frondihabitans sp. PhB188 TaxID=2485200 RepID=UPI000FB5CC69|nr:glycoside hydrolase family 13 protein [Frondihabitans sp. PhB188]ROQ38775.1 alpha-glucosidase [Frondihabitans sp. PhB188]
MSTLPLDDTATELQTAREWWRDAVIYQIYPRSFADSNGDGIGDFPGYTSKIPYLRQLGVDAVWLSPFYVSPQADAGYDVADYCDVNPLFGGLDDFDEFLRTAHEVGIRVVVDLVPNHSSDEHAWFRAALAAERGSQERARYVFREGRGAQGELPPNNWQSNFGGPAWTRIADGSWYLHLFDTKQPDFDWTNPEVADFFDDVLRFWLDRGVDGFRVDVAHALIKAENLPDIDDRKKVPAGDTGPMWDQEGVHDVYRRWHAVLDEYDGDRLLVAEAWVSPPERLARYVRPDEMHQAFNFPYMVAGWDAARLRAVIDQSIEANESVGAPTTWVLSNHDVVRHASRFGLADPTSWPNGIAPDDEQPDAALGLRRARAATLMMLALPGSAYVYQGEELGLPEATQLPADVRQDPTFARTGGAEAGRDGCRIPLPWVKDAPAFGFGPSADVWLPQPDSYGPLAADQQVDDPSSTYSLYRTALELRARYGLGSGSLAWDADGFGFTNGSVRVVSNFGTSPVGVDGEILVSSDGTAGPTLAQDATAWVLVP